MLTSLRAARARMLAAELEMRRLIAYAREFVRPRPYTLADLAEAAGMSISGIRTAYDDDEIGFVPVPNGSSTLAVRANSSLA